MASRALRVAVFAFALSACGDDTVNPSNPDAGPSKDATADGAHKDGGDSAAEDARPDALDDGGGVVHQNDGGKAEASDDAPVD